MNSPALQRFLSEPGGHILLDEDLKIVEAGPQFSRMNFVEPDMLAGKALFDILYADEGALRQIQKSINCARSTKVPDKIGPLRMWVKPLPGDKGKPQERWWSFATIPVEDGLVVQRVEDHTTEMVALRAIHAQRKSNYILYALCLICIGVVTFVALHDKSSISAVSNKTCRIQSIGLAGIHQLSRAMGDIADLLAAPTTPKQRLQQAGETHRQLVAQRDLRYYSRKYQVITSKAPSHRICP